MKVKTLATGVGCALLIASSWGCGGAGREQTAQTPPPATVPATPETGSSTGSPATAASGAAAPPPASPASPFHVVATSNSQMILRPLEGKLLIQYGDGFARAEGDSLVADVELARNLPSTPFGTTVRVDGRWPDKVWATTMQSDGRSGYGELYEWKGKAWKATASSRLPFNSSYLGVSPYTNGSYLALAYQFMPFGQGLPVQFKVVGGPGRAPSFAFEPGKEEYCRVAMVPEMFRAFPTGHVVVSGVTCGEQSKGVFQYWAPGQTKGLFQVVDGTDKLNSDSSVIAASSAEDIYLSWSAKDRSTLVHFDGKDTQPVALPEGMTITTMTTAPDGTLWVVANGKVYKRGSSGDFAEIQLPSKDGQAYAADAIYVAGADDVWVSAGETLLRTKPAPQVQELTWEYGQQERSTVARPRAANWQCRDIFVLMYGVTKVTPANYDYPLTRKALKGHTEFAGVKLAETEDGGRRYFGAFVEDLTLAHKMAKLVEKSVQGSMPQVLCVRPKVLRTMEIDWRTGNVLSNSPVAE